VGDETRAAVETILEHSVTLDFPTIALLGPGGLLTSQKGKCYYSCTPGLLQAAIVKHPKLTGAVLVVAGYLDARGYGNEPSLVILKRVQYSPANSPQYASPQTQWGLRVMRSIMSIVSWSGVDNLFAKLASVAVLREPMALSHSVLMEYTRLRSSSDTEYIMYSGLCSLVSALLTCNLVLGLSLQLSIHRLQYRSSLYTSPNLLLFTSSFLSLVGRRSYYYYISPPATALKSPRASFPIFSSLLPSCPFLDHSSSLSIIFYYTYTPFKFSPKRASSNSLG